MTSPFFGLDIASRALRTQQTLLDISNQNIANANTPGYSRQTATVRPTLAYPIPTFSASGIPGQLGTGVEVVQISRARNGFTDFQYRNQLTSQGRWDARRDALNQVESIVNEPSSTGISALMTKYWKSWQEVANSPSDSAVRASLIEQGRAVGDAFQSVSSQLHQQQRDLDQQVQLTVTDINSYAHQIADVNLQISQVETAGMQANDLRDQRDLLLDQLSKLAKVTYVESSEGSVSVYLGNRQLVDRSTTHELEVAAPPGQPFYQVQWAEDGAQAIIPDGKLKGILESRDDVVQKRIDDLDTLAARLIESVNSVHQSGVGLNGQGGVAFFSGTDASTIAVSSTLTAAGGTDYVAAARMVFDTATSTYTYARGDSSNAVAMAAIQSAVAQRSGTSGLQPGSALAGPPATTVLGTDLGRAAVGTTFNVSTSGTTVTFNNGSTTATGTVTVGTDSGGNQIVVVDAASFGVRLTLRAAAGAPLAGVLGTLNGTSLATGAAPSTVGDQYGQQIASMGVESSTAQTQSTNQLVLVNQLKRQRDENSSVSLDEEAANLIQYQHAYQAAARVITVVDEMLNTLINSTGTVGR